MNWRRIVTASVLCAALGMALATATGRQATGIERVSWLQGCWHLERTGTTIEEHWMTPRGGSMVAMSRTVRRGALAEYELVVLKEDGDRLVYQAHPSGQAAESFPSVEIADQRVVFENQAHDFPKRIGYERQGDRLTAWIEGPRNGQTRRVEFAYTRATCPGQPR